MRNIFILSVIVISLVSISVTAYCQVKKLVKDSAITGQDTQVYNWQKSNKDFYNRITQFSQLSWACLPYNDLGSDKKGYILSADISPHFFIGGERMRFAISLTPRYQVRILRNQPQIGDTSLPVRTPSFMPGATIYLPIHLGDPRLYKNVQFLSLSFFHHSNGQDGPTFKSPGVFNYSTGNFSTNYFELGYTYNWRRPISNKNSCFDCSTSQFPTGYNDRVLKVALEQHIWTDDSVKSTYSDTRLNGSFSYIKVKNWRWTVRRKIKDGKDSFQQVGKCFLKESYRIVLNASVNLDKPTNPYGNFNRMVNFEAGIYRRIAAGNTSVFGMIGYYGNDPYNIY